MDTNKTNLDRLNELLQKADIPDFRKKVSPSMNNLKWLRHAFLDKEGTPAELNKLLQMDPKTLLRPMQNVQETVCLS